MKYLKLEINKISIGKYQVVNVIYIMYYCYINILFIPIFAANFLDIFYVL